MKFFKIYTPEIAFIILTTILWTVVFRTTNVGHSYHEIIASAMLVIALDLCAFTAYHLYFQMRRASAALHPQRNLLLIIKPDGIAHATDILKTLGQYGQLHHLTQIAQLPRDILEKHYAHIKDKPFFESTIDYMMSGSVLMGILTCASNEDVTKAREALGATNPTKAAPNTLRGRFGTVEGDLVKNVAHLSDSYEAGDTEIDLWEDFLL